MRSWRVSGHADALWNDYWDESPRNIKHAIVADAAESVASNRETLRQKAQWLTATQVLLMLEVVSVVVAVVVDRMS